jgi:hypothetical protein
MTMGKTYEELQEEVAAGTPGNQALWALYRPNNRGVWERIRHAEGNQVSYEAQTAERNYMDQRQSSMEVTGYKKSLEKNIVIEKGDADYEWFNDFQRHEYKGRDALVDLLEVDLMHSERSGGGELWYIARKTKMAVTVTSLDATGGTLSASFSQCGDTEHGIAACLTADPDAPTFKSEKEIAPVMADIDPVSLKVGETAAVPVSFTSFGTRKDRFDVSVSSGADKVKAERLRDGVVITGLAATASQTPATVTVTSAQSGGASKNIAVTVT